MESSTASAATAAALVISTTIHSASALAEGPSLPSLPPPAAQSDARQKRLAVASRTQKVLDGRGKKARPAVATRRRSKERSKRVDRKHYTQKPRWSETPSFCRITEGRKEGGRNGGQETWINAVAPRPETKSVNVVAVPRFKSPFVSSVGAENKGPTRR